MNEHIEIIGQKLQELDLTTENAKTNIQKLAHNLQEQNEHIINNEINELPEEFRDSLLKELKNRIRINTAIAMILLRILHTLE